MHFKILSRLLLSSGYGGYGGYGRYGYGGKKYSLHKTKYAINDYLYKTHALGKKNLQVSLNYLNTPQEAQYLNQVWSLTDSFRTIDFLLER